MIRYYPAATSIQLIQSRGRARAAGSRFVKIIEAGLDEVLNNRATQGTWVQRLATQQGAAGPGVAFEQLL